MTSISVKIYQPVWTGEPCHWSICFTTGGNDTLCHIMDPADEHFYGATSLNYHILETLHIGVMPNGRVEMAQNLLLNNGTIPSRDYTTQDWVYSCLLQLSVGYSLDFIFGWREILRAKRAHRPIGIIGTMSFDKL
jgi:hypothetical protein